MMSTPSPPVTPQSNRQHQNSNRRFVPANQLQPHNNNSLAPSKQVFEDIITSQGTLKRDIMRNDETVQAVRQENIMLAEKVQHATNLYRQLLGRLSKTEERMELEHRSMSQVISQAKQIEIQLINQQDNLTSREQRLEIQVSKLQEEVSILKTERDQTRKTHQQVSHDLRQLQEKVTRQSGTLSNGLQDLKSHLDQKDAEKTQTFMIAINDLRERVENTENDRVMFQTKMEGSMETLKMKIEQIDKQRQEDTYNMASLTREKEALAKADIRRLQEKFRDVFNEFNKNLSGKDGRLRSDLEGRVQDLESKLLSQKKSTNQKVQEIEEEASEKIQQLKDLMQIELENFKGKVKGEFNDEETQQIKKQIKALEKQINGNKKEIEKVVRAEISSRLTQGEKITQSVNQIQKDYNEGVNLLQSMIQDLKRKHEQAIVEQKYEIQRNVTALRDELKNVFDPKRLVEIEQKLEEIEDALDEFAKMEERIELNSERVKQIEMENILAQGDINNNIDTNTKRINQLDKRVQESFSELEHEHEILKRPSTAFRVFKAETEEKLNIQGEVPSKVQLIERKLRVISESLEEIRKNQVAIPSPEEEKESDEKETAKLKKLVENMDILISVLKAKIDDELTMRKKDKLLTVLKARLEELEKSGENTEENDDDAEDDDEEEDDDLDDDDDDDDDDDNNNNDKKPNDKGKNKGTKDTQKEDNDDDDDEDDGDDDKDDDDDDDDEDDDDDDNDDDDDDGDKNRDNNNKSKRSTNKI